MEPADVALTDVRLARWAAPALVAGVMLLASVVLWPSTSSLVAEWRDTQNTTYTHGWLVLAISIWLPFRRFAAADAAAIAPNYRVAALLAVGSLLWLVAVNAGIQLAHQALLPVLIWGALHAVIGRAARRYWFAVAYLYFAIPVWNIANGVLREVTVAAVRLLLSVSGASVYVDGNFVYLASGTFEIADGCSGLHFFIVALALAALYGELHGDTPKKRMLLLAAAAAVAVVSNWIRVFTIIMAGYLTDMQHFLIRVDHYYFGWIVFAVGMFGFFFAAARLLAASTQAADEVAQPRVDAPLARFRPASARLAFATGAAMLALGLGPLWLQAITRFAAVDAATAQIPRNPGRWHGPHPNEGGWHPVFVSADAVGQADYRAGDVIVTAYIATYARQHQGKELIGYANSVVGRDSRQSVAARAQRRVQGRAFMELRIQRDDAVESLIWYHYLVGSQVTVSERLAQFTYAVRSLVSPTPSSVIAYRRDCIPDCESARAALADFAAAAMPPLAARGLHDEKR